MSGAGHISPPFSGAAGEKHAGSTDSWLSIVSQMTFALILYWLFNKWEWEKSKQKNDII